MNEPRARAAGLMQTDSQPATAPRRTALIWHERFAWYQPGLGASFIPPGGLVQPFEPVDAPASKVRFRSLIDVSGLSNHLTVLAATEATDGDLLTFHDEGYLDRLRKLDAVGCGDAGLATPVGADVYVTARLSAGGCLLAVDEVMSGRHDNAYALVRPPGHHARRNEGLGSCVLANGVLAVHRARSRHGVRRVACIDWDVHHGNSMQEAFWDDPDALTISVHQDGFFPPGSGGVDERGGHDAIGTNINVPLPPGAGHDAFMRVAERIIEPALSSYRPDLLFVSSGYDAAAVDPMGRMLLHSGSFRALARMAIDIAGLHCEGRLVVMQEGGVSPPYTPFCGVAVVEEMVGVNVCEDPFLEMLKQTPGAAVTREQARSIEAAAAGLTLA